MQERHGAWKTFQITMEESGGLVSASRLIAWVLSHDCYESMELSLVVDCTFALGDQFGFAIALS